jgi:hypothetical protein
MSLNPESARFAKISQPSPPAPMTRILHLFRRKAFTFDKPINKYEINRDRLIYLLASCEGWIGSRTRLVQDLVYVIVAIRPIMAGCYFSDLRGVCRHEFLVLVFDSDRLQYGKGGSRARVKLLNADDDRSPIQFSYPVQWSPTLQEPSCTLDIKRKVCPNR